MPIAPTVGRKIWYRPFAAERCQGYESNDEPLDATVLKVWGPNMVNLLVFNEEGGRVASKTSVTLRDSYDDAVPGECGWPVVILAHAPAAVPGELVVTHQGDLPDGYTRVPGYERFEGSPPAPTLETEPPKNAPDLENVAVKAMLDGITDAGIPEPGAPGAPSRSSANKRK